ncbi:fatty acid synthase-like isoform X2 [Tetranychus urticae]|uniref:fatty acid synthase-like isoform X2 n=1 Tax=Tetranychus urticae TaxID=32264 RepID=UPI00077BB42F|nr:fatty acid synthase-like isoform X2 [Tetranychus urticae]
MDKKPEIVISGVSGRFPDCSNIEELKDKLYNGVDMLIENEERWPKGTYGLPSKSGILKGLHNFDASFFGLSDKEADLLDPSIRFSIETIFEALCDAGLNPWSLGERKVGLFYSQMYNEIDRSLGLNDEEALSFPQLLERLVAYIFDIKGGVFLYETACSSSVTTLNEAFVQLTHGCIDLAIVCGANILWSPSYALFFHRLGLTSQDGTCRFLDSKASGYGRGETVTAVILERVCDAQRVHAHLIYASTNCDGYKSQGITYPSWKAQANLIDRCYQQASIDPTEMHFFECHGTGTEVGDMEEVKAIWSILGKNRPHSNKPLLLGSIKSNLGHCESASGLPSLIKCLLILKYKSIPPNLHYEQPSPRIPELLEGLIAPVLNVTPFDGKYISINNFGFGGANGHFIIAASAPSESRVEGNSEIEERSILLLCCGRNELSLQTIVNGIMNLQPNQITLHFARLVNRYAYNMSYNASPHSKSMNYRSYIISHPLSRKVSPVCQLPSSLPLLCFTFPGAGCQMDNMIKPFMCLKPFKESIEDSLAIIDPLGVKHIRELLFGPTQGFWKIFALGIFQIAVVDTLKSIGIVPDIIVGHSFGEFCCAYADGFMSKHEILDICYSLINVCYSVVASKTFKSCKMISIGLCWDELSPLIPYNLYPACFNAVDNITLAGLTEDVDTFAEFLAKQNIFFRLVDSCECGFHTPALNEIAEKYRQELSHYSNVYRSLSKRWIISHESSLDLNSSINAQIFWVEAIRNVVKFEKACQSIPKDAICIEISPKRFLTTLLKRNLPDLAAIEVPFEIGIHHTPNNDTNHVPDSLLQSLGNLFLNGYDINLDPLLFDQLNSPAPIETPFLSPLIKLDHSIPRLIRRFPEFYNNNSAQEKFIVNLTKEGNQHFGCFYYNGHQVIPFSGLIYAIWSKFASLTAQNTNELPIRLERVKLRQLIQLKKDQNSTLSFCVNFVPTFGSKYNFAITLPSTNLVIMTGLVSVLNDSIGSLNDANQNDNEDSSKVYTRPNNIGKNVFYGILSRCGLHYQGDLRNVVTVNIDEMEGKMSNHQDWIVRIEALLQLASFANQQSNHKTISSIPSRLDEIHCVPSKSIQGLQEIEIFRDKLLGVVASDDIYIRGIHFGSFQLPSQLDSVTLSVEQFTPRFTSEAQDLETSISIIMELFFELNQHQIIVSITVADDYVNGTLGDSVKYRLQQRKSPPLNLIEIDSINQLTNGNISRLDDNDISTAASRLLILETDKINLFDYLRQLFGPVISNVDFIIVLQTIKNVYSPDEKNNIIVKGNNNNDEINNNDINDYEYFKYLDLTKLGLVMVACHLTNQGYLYLIRRSIDPVILNVKKVNIESLGSSTFMSHDNQNVDQQANIHFLIVNNLSSSMGLIDTLEKDDLTVNDEKQKTQLKWLINETSNFDGNDIKHCLDELMKIGLTYNVLRNGVQGSFHYLPVNLTSDSSSSKANSKLNNLDDSLGQLLFHSSFISSVICSNQCSIQSNFNCHLIGFSGLKADGSTEIGIIRYNSVTCEYQIIISWPFNQPKWSLEEASTIPLPYYLAYYAVIIRSRLQTNETVLIVNGHSPVGCAIIAIGLKLECTLYLTVETEDQKLSIRKQFPSLGNHQFIITATSEGIEQTIMDINNGHGCDLVANTMVLPAINNDVQGYTSPSQVKGNMESILECLTVGGRCVDLNKSPMSDDDDLGLAVFLKNITYHGATPEGLFQALTTDATGNSFKIHQQVIDLVHKGIANGTVCPLPNSRDLHKIELSDYKNRFNHQQSTPDKPMVDIIFGQPGDIELEIIKHSERTDKVSNFIILTSSKSSKFTTIFPSSPFTSASSNSPVSSSVSNSLLSPPASSLSPLCYHSSIINQLGLLDDSSVKIFDFIETIDKKTKYDQVLKDISHNYTVNKVFLVYRGSHQDNHQFRSQLMIELLDYITNSEELSINFLTLISCSLSQDFFHRLFLLLEVW